MNSVLVTTVLKNENNVPVSVSTAVLTFESYALAAYAYEAINKERILVDDPYHRAERIAELY